MNEYASKLLAILAVVSVGIFQAVAESPTSKKGADTQKSQNDEAPSEQTVPKTQATVSPEKLPPDTLAVGSKHWKSTDFEESGKIRVEEGVLYLEQGNDMTGVTWTGPIIRMDYEIALEAKRVEGDDFFCGLTFPVGEDHCSLIVGGWGGTVCGLSSLDYQDAYNNETARFITFKSNEWYPIRVRVTKGKIEAWIDGKREVNVKTKDRGIGVRWEMENSRPIGIATWCTTGAIRDIRMIPVEPDPFLEEEDEDEDW